MADPRMQLEASFAAKVFDALKAWIAKVRTAVMRPWVLYKGRPNPAGVQEVSDLWTRTASALVAELKIAAEQGFSEVAGARRSGEEQLIEQSLAASYRLMVGIPDEVQQLIQGEINAAVNSGATPDQIAARVDQLLDASGAARWKNRAKVIAATEVHRSANAGVQAAAMGLSRLDSVRLNKKWVTRHDDRVRTNHSAADGQTVGINQRFSVGTSKLLYPGDPEAPAEEVVNCRCSMKIQEAS